MKPKILIFQGFNSFSERAEIDFDKLSGNGLFGIFGKTGSGKSTILDCMMYALFAKTARNQTIKEYVNNKTNSAFVDFTFEVLTAGERKTYNIRRTIKINKRGSADTTAFLGVYDGDNLMPYDDVDINARIKEIIGIGYEEFSKCIILPQNEFATFVKSTKTDRLKLVCKLFALDKFDTLLLRALKERIAKIKLELSAIGGELIHYEKYTTEYLNDLKTTQNTQKQQISALKERRSALEKEIESGAENYSLKKQMIETEREIVALKQKEPLIEEYKKCIETSSVANRVKEANDLCVATEKQAVTIKSLINDLNLTKNQLLQKIDKVLIEKGKDRHGRIRELTVLLSRLNDNINTAKEIDALRVEYSKQRADIKAFEIENERLMREKANLLSDLAALGSPQDDLERLFDTVGASALASEIKGELEYFNEKLLSIEVYRGESMYCVVESEIKGRIEYLSNRLSKIAVGDVSAEFLSQRLAEIKAATDKHARVSKRLAEIGAKAEAFDSQMQLMTQNAQKLLKDGETKSAILSALSNDVGFDVGSGAKLSSGIEKLSAEINRLEKEISFYDEQEKLLTAEHGKVNVSIAEQTEKYAQAQTNCQTCVDSLNKILLESGFETVLQACRYALDENKLSEYNLRVNDYQDRLTSANALYKKLSNLLEGVDFDMAEYESKKNQIPPITHQIDMISGSLSIAERDIADAVCKMDEAKVILARQRAEQDKFNLCDKLEKVLANHNLLNFIAEEYLSDISHGAARTLLTLTGGRYDLIYDGEFFILDNHNCGERRAVSTLSGGETFLVSLSLALALSQAICDRTMRPVEFFFLDEGFGTLDAELTDVVINSLERLKGEHFTIGLISHVPELKQRISSKILVSPASAAESSKLEIIY